MNSEIEVTLFWSEAANRIIVEARDWRSDEAVEFEVDGDAALDAFNHPYAYAATRHVRNPAATHVAAGRWWPEWTASSPAERPSARAATTA